MQNRVRNKARFKVALNWGMDELLNFIWLKLSGLQYNECGEIQMDHLHYRYQHRRCLTFLELNSSVMRLRRCLTVCQYIVKLHLFLLLSRSLASAPSHIWLSPMEIARSELSSSRTSNYLSYAQRDTQLGGDHKVNNLSIPQRHKKHKVLILNNLIFFFVHLVSLWEPFLVSPLKCAINEF